MYFIIKGNFAGIDIMFGQSNPDLLDFHQSLFFLDIQLFATKSGKANGLYIHTEAFTLVRVLVTGASGFVGVSALNIFRPKNS